MRRREFLVLPASSLGGALIGTLLGEPAPLEAQDGSVRVPLRFFTAAEATTIAAACERIFPSDESGAGAREAGAVIYIDRQLAGPYGRDKYRYTKGPWVESAPEHGYQGKAAPRQIYRDGIRQLGDFVRLTPAEQDEKLTAIERSIFFQMLRTHTIEGVFCDPMHGGNVGMTGWRLIGYPGPLMSFRDDIEKFRGVPFRREPVSLSQIVGRPVKGWEDETG